MPISSHEGKLWLEERIVALEPATILDVGAGQGAYSILFRPRLPLTTFIAVEIFEPYVARFDLHERYHTVIIGDARTVELPPVDVVILGDVLEHMIYPEAQALWCRCRTLARQAVFASIPIIELPQGAVGGNEYERHHQTWTHAMGLALPGVTESWTGEVIGCYHAPVNN